MTTIVYGSTMGNTESGASIIKGQIEGDVKLLNVLELNKESFKDSSLVILGSSTWGIGELQDDWFDKIDILRYIDF